MDRNNCSRRRVGALNSLYERDRRAALFNNEGCSCRSQSAPCPCAGASVYYNGCCGPVRCACTGVCPRTDASCPSGGCERCEIDECSCGQFDCAFAMFTAVSPVAVADGGHVQLEMEDGDTCCFRECGGRISILRDGVYFAVFTVRLPAGVSAGARLAMAVDGERIFPSETEVTVETPADSRSFTGHAVFAVSRGQRLTIESEGSLNIPSSSGTSPIVEMSLMRLG